MKTNQKFILTFTFYLFSNAVLIGREFDLNFAKGEINSGALKNSQSAVFKSMLFDCVTNQGCNYNIQLPGGKLHGDFASFVYDEKFGNLEASLKYKGGKTTPYKLSDATFNLTDSFFSDMNHRIGKPDKYDLHLDLSYPIGEYFKLRGGIYYDRLLTMENGYSLIFENPKLFKTIEPGTERLLFNSQSRFLDKEGGALAGISFHFPFWKNHSIEITAMGFQISGRSRQDNLTFPVIPGSSPNTQDFNNSRYTFTTITTGSIATLKYEWKVFTKVSIQILMENYESRVTSKNAQITGIERDNGVLKFDFTPTFGRESSVGGSKYFNFGAKYYY